MITSWLYTHKTHGRYDMREGGEIGSHERRWRVAG
jgi:hypothetical protein